MSRRCGSSSGRTETSQHHRVSTLTGASDPIGSNIDSMNKVKGWLKQVQNSRGAAEPDRPYQRGLLNAKERIWRPHSLPAHGVEPKGIEMRQRSPSLFVGDSPLPSVSSQISDDDVLLAEGPQLTISDDVDHQGQGDERCCSSEQSRSGSFRKRPRRKTRQDRYDAHKNGRVARKSARSGKKHKPHKKRPIRSGREVVDNFITPAVAAQRLTVCRETLSSTGLLAETSQMKPNLSSGLFVNGRGGTPGDLTFNQADSLGLGWAGDGQRGKSRRQTSDKLRRERDMQVDSDFFANITPREHKAPKVARPTTKRPRCKSPVVVIGSGRLDVSRDDRIWREETEEPRQSARVCLSPATKGERRPVDRRTRMLANQEHPSLRQPSLSAHSRSRSSDLSPSNCDEIGPHDSYSRKSIQRELYQPVTQPRANFEDRVITNKISKQTAQRSGYTDAGVQTTKYRDTGTMVSPNSMGLQRRPASPPGVGLCDRSAPQEDNSLQVALFSAPKASEPEVPPRECLDQGILCRQPAESESARCPEAGDQPLKPWHAGQPGQTGTGDYGSLKLPLAQITSRAHDSHFSTSDFTIASPVELEAFRPFKFPQGRPMVQPCMYDIETVQEAILPVKGRESSQFLDGFSSILAPSASLRGRSSMSIVPSELPASAGSPGVGQGEKIHDFIARVESEILGTMSADSSLYPKNEAGSPSQFLDKNAIDTQIHDTMWATSIEDIAGIYPQSLTASTTGVRHGHHPETYAGGRGPPPLRDETSLARHGLAARDDQLEMKRFWRPNVYR